MCRIEHVPCQTSAVSNMCRVQNQLASWNSLICILHCMEERMRSCNRTCLVCDADLEFVAVKPCVCSEALCTSRHTMFGFGLDIVQELTVRKQRKHTSHPGYQLTFVWCDLTFPDTQVRREVSDLLISMFFSAALNTTRISLCFPHEVVSRDGSLTFRKPDGTNDVELLCRVVNLVPSVDVMLELAKGSEAQLRNALEPVHPLLFPLLRWIFASSRGYLRALEPGEVSMLASFSMCARDEVGDC